MNSDWLQQVNRIEKSYETLFRQVDHGDTHGTIFGLSRDDAPKTYHGDNRFPPRARPHAIGSIDNEKYNLCESDAQLELSAGPDAEQTAGAILLSKLGGLRLKIRENREQARARGQYLQSQPLTAMDQEASYLSEVLLELRSLGEDAQHLVQEVDTLQFAREAALPPAAAAYCQTLRLDASATELQLEALLELAEDMLYSPRGELCRLDGIEPDWKALAALHRAVAAQPVAARAVRYTQMTTQKKLPVCQPLYDFLCDPRQHAYMLCICGYGFAAGELAAVLSFLASDCAPAPSSFQIANTASPRARAVSSDASGAVATANQVHELLLDSCGLTDADIHEVVTYLPDFLALHTLSLRGNSMSSAGATNLATVTWEHGLPLRTLQLDRNNISDDGACMIAKCLHRCRYLQRLSVSYNPIGDAGFYYLVRASMNPYRRARRSLPRPPELTEDNGEDFHSDNEDSESEEGAISESSDDDDDAYTVVEDDESVYSRQIEYIPSSIMNRRGLALAAKLRELKEAQKRSHKTLLQKWYARVRIKVMAVAALLRLRSRGHNIHTLEAAGCGLGPFSLQVLAHALSDNHNMATVVLADNAVGHSEYEKADNSTLHRLLSESRLLHLSLRSCGIFEHNVEAMVRAMNRGAVRLHSVDLSGNHLGPTGANMVASLHSFFVDQMSIGTGYKTPGALTRPIDLEREPLGKSNQFSSSRQRVGTSSSGKSNTSRQDINNAGPSVPAPLTSHADETSPAFDDDNDFEGDDGRFIDRQHLAAEEEAARRQAAMAFGADEEKGAFEDRA